MREMNKSLMKKNHGPFLGQVSHGIGVAWPVMEKSGVEVCAVWPDDGVDFRVHECAAEELWITERTVQLSGEDRLEVDLLLGLVFEPDSDRVVPQDLDLFDAMNSVGHRVTSQRRGSILEGGRPLWRRLQFPRSSL